jgi:hypothetical protein
VLPASTTLERNDYFRRHPTVPPSWAAQPKAQEKLQTSQDPQILCNRPSSLISIPVVLLHPIFGQFVDNCRDHVATPEDHKLVHKLSGQMSNYFDSEAKRRDAFVQIMSEDLGLHLIQSGVSGGYSTNGHAVTHNHVYVITEAKHELGTGGTDPAYQCASYYLEFLRNHRQESVLPCLHLYYAGELGNGYWEIRSIFTFIKVLSLALEAQRSRPRYILMFSPPSSHWLGIGMNSN